LGSAAVRHSQGKSASARSFNASARSFSVQRRAIRVFARSLFAHSALHTPPLASLRRQTQIDRTMRIAL
jgi:hypothetical protein